MKIIDGKLARQKATFKISISNSKKGFNVEVLRYTNLQLLNDGVTPELRKEAIASECFIGENGFYALEEISKRISVLISDILKEEKILNNKTIINIIN